jgi:hypothetical protein
MLRRLWAAEQAARAAAPPPGPRGAHVPPLPRGLVVLPYLSIVSEKAGDLARLAAGMRWMVQGYQGEREKEGTPLAGKVGLPQAPGRGAEAVGHRRLPGRGREGRQQRAPMPRSALSLGDGAEFPGC